MVSFYGTRKTDNNGGRIEIICNERKNNKTNSCHILKL